MREGDWWEPRQRVRKPKRRPNLKQKPRNRAETSKAIRWTAAMLGERHSSNESANLTLNLMRDSDG
jgi:hypothetical protein